MKAKTDQWVESNIYRDKVEGMLRHLRSASVADKMTVRRFISEHTDYHGKMCMDTGVMAMLLAVIELGWAGTGSNATRLPKLVETAYKILEETSDRLGESSPQALYNRLYEQGVEYDISDSPWIHKQKYRE
jgi:hypothetical protein